MNRKIVLLVFVLSVFFFIFPSCSLTTVKADELQDSVNEQLDNIDLSQLEDYFNKLENNSNESIIDYINSIVKGEYAFDYNSIFQSILNIFLNKVFQVLPIFLTIIAIAIFCGLTQNFKSSFLTESTSNIIFFVCFISIILILSTGIIGLYQDCKITIENIAKLTQIMSPIILTLMVATGSSVSASVYKPAVAFLSSAITSVFLSIVLPLIGIMFVFVVISNLSNEIKLNKYIDLISGITKWIIGITVTVFGVFLSVQGITSACHDGISLRITKYTISNSIPIVGGFVKDGFEIVVLAGVLLKNAIGLSSVFLLFSTILSPIVYLIVFSTLLRLTAALTESVADIRISNFCTSISKCLTYLSATLILVGFMLFITILLMILSANSLF